MYMQTLKQRILTFFQKNPDRLIPSGEIQRLVHEKTKYTPSNATRRLRELAQEGLLTVKLIKGHAHYKLAYGGHLEANNSKLQETLKAMELYWKTIWLLLANILEPLPGRRDLDGNVTYVGNGVPITEGLLVEVAKMDWKEATVLEFINY